MSPHAKPIILLVAGYLILAIVLIVPRVIRQYRRTGQVRDGKKILVLTFVIYTFFALYLTFKPLHSSHLEKGRSVVLGNDSSELFHVVKQIKADPRVFLENPWFYQAVFNFMIAIPLGFYYYIFKEKIQKRNEKYGWIKIIGITFICSVGIKLVQKQVLINLKPVFPSVFDLDDVWLNVAGGIFGYLLTPIAIFFLPKWTIDIEELSNKKAVSYIMQIVELYLSILLVNILAIGSNSLIGTGGPWIKLMFSTLFYFMLNVLMPRIFDGWTFSGAILNIKLIADKTKNYCPYFVRMLLIFVPLWFNEIALWVCAIVSDDSYIVMVQVIVFFVTVILWGIVYFDIIMKWFKGAGSPYYNQKSGVKVQYYSDRQRK